MTAEAAITPSPEQPPSVFGPHTQYIVDERRSRLDYAQTPESKSEIKVDKSELKTHLTSLISSTHVAIGRLESQLAKNPGAREVAGKIAEYQVLQANAQVILSELNEPGAGHNLSAFSAALEAIQSDSAYEADKPDESSGSKPSVDVIRFVLTRAQEDEIISDQPLIRHLRHHAHVMQQMSVGSVQLSAQGGINIEEGYKDLLATIAMSAALYDQANGDDKQKATQTLSDIITMRGDEIAQKAMAMGATDSEAKRISDEHIMRIEQQALYIHEGTLGSDDEGRKRMLDSFKYFVQEPLQGHIEQSKAHFDAARNDLEQGPRYLQKLAKHMEDWDRLEGKVAGICADSKCNPNLRPLSHDSGEDLYRGLMKEVNVTGLMAESRHAMEEGKALHEAHSVVYYKAGKHLTRLENDASALFRGDSSNVAGVAKELGISEKHLRIQCLKCRTELGSPIGKDLGDAFTRDRIDSQTDRGQAVGLV